MTKENIDVLIAKENNTLYVLVLEPSKISCTDFIRKEKRMGVLPEEPDYNLIKKQIAEELGRESYVDEENLFS